MILQPFPSESDQLFQLPITEANNNMAGVRYNFMVVLTTQGAGRRYGAMSHLINLEDT